MNFELIAKICHDVNRLWCAMNEDYSQVPWSDAEDWQKSSALQGVEFIVANPDAGDSALHDAWTDSKIADGWVFGIEKDAELKTHPYLVEFEELPQHQQFKDALFRTIVLSSIGAI